MFAYGKTIRVDNFTITLTAQKAKFTEEEKKQMPQDVVETALRDGLPVLRIKAISGIWELRLAMPHPYFAVLSALYDEEKEEWEENGLELTRFILQMLYTDTSFFGDATYNRERMQSLEGFIKRQMNKDTDEENDEVLRDMEKMQDDLADIALAVDSAYKANNIKKEENEKG